MTFVIAAEDGTLVEQGAGTPEGGSWERYERARSGDRPEQSGKVAFKKIFAVLR